MLRNGQWKKLMGNKKDIKMCDLFKKINENYKLCNDKIYKNLAFTYHSYSFNEDCKSKKPDCIRIGVGKEREEKLLRGRDIRVSLDQQPRQLTIDDLTLHVHVEPGTIIQEDVNCNSEFMMDSLHPIGKSIRKSFFFVDKQTPIYLFMDNAGGHGTNVIKVEWAKIWKNEYNVIFEFRPSNSPGTNLLDLGVWMTFQHMVERIHKERNCCLEPFALYDSAVRAWNAMVGLIKFEEVAEQWKLVLKLIIADNGGNDKVESCRGLRRALRNKKPIDKKYDYLVYDDEEASCSDVSIESNDDKNDGDDDDYGDDDKDDDSL